MFKSKEELRDWIINYINNRGKKSLHVAINNSAVIKDDIIKYTIFLPKESKYNQRCYHIINNIDEIPVCKFCKEKKVNFNNRNKKWGYLDYCSSRCGRINDNSIKKYKETNINKWGVDNYSKTDVFKESMISINNHKYGLDWYQQSKDFRNKSIKTCLEKYGFTSYSKTAEFKNKVSEIFLKNWGVDWYTKSNDFKVKFRKTCMDRYGTNHFMLNDNCVSNFKVQFKDYTLPSGRIVKIQGYENFALDIILSKYNEDDIFISNTEIRSEIGIINYLIDDHERIYIPDIYIKSENKIIEVKSKWTYKIEIEKNNLKKMSCIDSGINFEFWIINRNGKLFEIL